MNYRGTISANPTGTNLSRYVQALCRGKGSLSAAAQIASGTPSWQNSPEVALTLRAIVDAVSTDGAGSALASYGIAAELVDLLRGVSVVEKLKSRMFPAAFRAATPIESTAPTGEWISESGALPVTSAAFGSATLEPTKIGSIAVLTKELVERSGLVAEAAISRIMRNALSYVLDFRFLSSTMTAVSGLRPGAITASGASSVSSTGSTSAQIQADLASMVAALGSWRDPVFIMRQSTLTSIQARNPQLVVFAGAQPLLLGLPVFTSLGSPQQIVLCDVASIMLADGFLDISISDKTSLEMSTTPIQGDESPLVGGTVLRSLFQANAVAVKCVREISWARTLASGVVVMPTTY